MGKNIGIWIDRSKAYIIDDENTMFDVIESNVEDFHSAGGSASSTPYGNQDASGEKEMQERQRNQMKHYVKDLSSRVQDSSRVVVFGPAQAKNELAKEIESNHLFKGKLVGIETTDSMSDTKLKEWVRNFYNK